MHYIINDRIKFDKKKTFTDFFLERRFRWGNPHRRPFHSLPTDSASHSKKNAPKFSLLEHFFWPVQRPNPRNNPPFVIENTARKSIPLSVIARSEATKQSREGTLVHWIASLRSQ